MFIQFKQKLERAYSKDSFDAAGKTADANKHQPYIHSLIHSLTIQFGSAKRKKKW